MISNTILPSNTHTLLVSKNVVSSLWIPKWYHKKTLPVQYCHGQIFVSIAVLASVLSFRVWVFVYFIKRKIQRCVCNFLLLLNFCCVSPWTGEVLGANINRSPSAYLNNPLEERAKYNYDVDKNMSLLKFVDAEWGPVGSFSWFAVHGTSMNRTNTLISGDNKGAAARFMENWFESKKEVKGKVQEEIPITGVSIFGTAKRSMRGRSSILGTHFSLFCAKDFLKLMQNVMKSKVW